MHEWWFPPHPHSTCLLDLCKSLMDLREWPCLIDCNLCQVVMPTVAVIAFLEQINTSWYAAVDLTSAFVFIIVHSFIKTSLHSAGQWYTFTHIFQGSSNSPGRCHNLVHRHLHLLPFRKLLLWSITLMTLCWLDLLSEKYQIL